MKNAKVVIFAGAQIKHVACNHWTENSDTEGSEDAMLIVYTFLENKGDHAEMILCVMRFELKSTDRPNCKLKTKAEPNRDQ